MTPAYTPTPFFTPPEKSWASLGSAQLWVYRILPPSRRAPALCPKPSSRKPCLPTSSSVHGETSEKPHFEYLKVALQRREKRKNLQNYLFGRLSPIVRYIESQKRSSATVAMRRTKGKGGAKYYVVTHGNFSHQKRCKVVLKIPFEFKMW